MNRIERIKDVLFEIIEDEETLSHVRVSAARVYLSSDAETKSGADAESNCKDLIAALERAAKDT